MLVNWNLFNSMFPDYYKYRIPMWNETKETEEEITIDVVIPGYEKEDFNIVAQDDMLLLKINKDGEFMSYCISGYPYPLEKATAKYRNGILKITIPKSKKSKKELKIEVS
jgi:HSP20 family protein